MIELTRTVRFCVNPDTRPWGRADNTFASHPSMRGLGRYYELDVTCRGEVAPATGYFLNIKVIDQAVRTGAVPIIERACRERPEIDPAMLLGELLTAANMELKGTVSRLRWRLTPYYSVEMSADTKNTVLLKQQFEFAASHRLHSPGLSDEQNRATFGKCNNPSGHGHNYRVEPCVAIELGGAAGASGAPRFTLAELERLTNQTLIERYDHKHLNVDTPEFVCAPVGEGGRTPGLNPSVENIAKVCYERLAPVIGAAVPGGGVSLRSVTVWETDKTSCTYPG
jgi:6-pyruvoyltetrahydropterin/6-carboxytetrahydropterin synthase